VNLSHVIPGTDTPGKNLTNGQGMILITPWFQQQRMQIPHHVEQEGAQRFLDEVSGAMGAMPQPPIEEMPPR